MLQKVRHNLSVLYNHSAKLVITLFSQAGWSGINFIVTAVMARHTDPSVFGVFGLYLAFKRGVIAFTGGALVLPLTVISSRLETAESDFFVHKLVNTLYIIAVIILLLVMVVGYWFGGQFLALAVFLIGAVLLEVIRRLAYIKRRVKTDAAGAVVNCLVVLAVFYLLIKKDALSVPVAAGSMGLVYIFWGVLSGPKIHFRKGFLTCSDVKNIWNVGSWSLASNFFAYVYSEINTFYTFLLIGSPGVAVLELGRQFVAVLQPILFGMANYFHPIIAASASRDRMDVFTGKLIKLTAAQVLIGAAVIVGMLLAGPYLLTIILGRPVKEYQNVLPIAAILGTGAILRVGWQQPGFAMITLGYPKYTFTARAAGAVLAVSIGYVLTRQMGVLGAAWTKCLGDVLILIFSTVFYIKTTRSET